MIVSCLHLIKFDWIKETSCHEHELKTFETKVQH